MAAPEGLTGAQIKCCFPSVGATENVMLAAVLAKGTTKLINAAKEPEIEDLANVLNKMGADVKGAGTKTIVIKGVENLKGFKHSVIPDRIEAATYLIAAAITKGEITLQNAAPWHLRIIIDKLKKAGLSIIEKESKGVFPKLCAKWVKELKPQSVSTAVYPGFPTDVQAQWTALMCLLKGKSKVCENVFENRFLHIAELMRFGANIVIDGKCANIYGVKEFSGAPVMVSDLRAGAALVLAGLAACGKTVISRIYHLDRGYEMLEKKFRKLGADIRRVKK